MCVLCVCVQGMDRSKALHMNNSALSKHSLIQTEAREKDLDLADNQRKTSAGDSKR